PARIDDRLEVHTRYVRASGARIEAEQTIWRLDAEGVPREELWRAQVFAAVLDKAGRPRRLPSSVRDAMAPLVAPKDVGQ
ncbi:MAG: acyl-CoA thioesterase, partial [Alphaproteobacteria bacterium]|nr:acyl-CoA thioesterase [Alphaproteobacteria bacterium]MDX5417538.1 acyl-CoA thioesterase [Alphaproteobacteria bacterium]MDX5495020.1 acyl-CoA thioesterase [Alphaproteobacteria bacterium]